MLYLPFLCNGIIQSSPKLPLIWSPTGQPWFLLFSACHHRKPMGAHLWVHSRVGLCASIYTHTQHSSVLPPAPSSQILNDSNRSQWLSLLSLSPVRRERESSAVVLVELGVRLYAGQRLRGSEFCRSIRQLSVQYLYARLTCVHV